MRILRIAAACPGEAPTSKRQGRGATLARWWPPIRSSLPFWAIRRWLSVGFAVCEISQHSANFGVSFWAMGRLFKQTGGVRNAIVTRTL